MHINLNEPENQLLFVVFALCALLLVCLASHDLKNHIQQPTQETQK